MFKKVLVFYLIFVGLVSVLYSQTPTISDFSPKNAPVGGSVTITGTNFTAGTKVFFGPVQANVNFVNSTSLIAIVPVGANYSNLRVFNSNGTAYSSFPFNLIFNTTQSITPSFLPKVDFATQNSTTNVQAMDIDGDNKPDLITTNAASNSISIFRNIATPGIINSSSLASRIDITVANWPRFVNTGDFDNDGKLDLLVTHDFAVNGVYRVSILKNISTPGNILFQAPVLLPAANKTSYSAIGDLDGDGKTDFVVSNSNSRVFSIYRNISATGILDSTSFAQRIEIIDSLTGPLLHEQIALADMNGDNKSDIVVVNNGTHKIRIYKNISTPGNIILDIVNRTTLPTALNAKGLVTADFDIDGKLDIGVANFSENTFSLYTNTSTVSSISFSSPLNIVAGSETFGFNAGDVDGNGKPDVVVTTHSTSPARVYVFKSISQPGLFSFTAPVICPVPFVPEDFAICDIDGDVRPDIITANYESKVPGTISIIRNTSPITTEINSIGNTIPEKFNLEQNFPNPFNPTTTIKFDIPKANFIILEVYNAQGSLVKTLVNGNLSAGSYGFTFDGSDFSSGVYFYKLITPDFSATNKMILIK